MMSIASARVFLPGCPGMYCNPDNEFSGRDCKRISWNELGLDGVDLIGGDGSQDVQESVDRQAVFGKIERRKLLDAADNGFSHITGIEQKLVGHGKRQGFHILTHASEEGQATA